MPCMVIVIGYLPRRDPELTQDQVTATSPQGQLVAGCPACSGSGLVGFNGPAAAETILQQPPGTSEMYVLSFDGVDDKDALSNARAWIGAERAWLNRAGKLIRTFTY